MLATIVSIISCIVTVITLILTIGKAIMKLNQTLAELNVTVTNLNSGLDEIKESNRNAHKDIYRRLDDAEHEITQIKSVVEINHGPDGLH